MRCPTTFFKLKLKLLFTISVSILFSREDFFDYKTIQLEKEITWVGNDGSLDNNFLRGNLSALNPKTIRNILKFLLDVFYFSVISDISVNSENLNVLGKITQF